MTPSASAPPIVYAVYLGCTTPQRLAAEWSLPVVEAARLLRRAERALQTELCRQNRRVLLRLTPVHRSLRCLARAVL